MWGSISWPTKSQTELKVRVGCSTDCTTQVPQGFAYYHCVTNCCKLRNSRQLKFIISVYRSNTLVQCDWIFRAGSHWWAHIRCWQGLWFSSEAWGPLQGSLEVDRIYFFEVVGLGLHLLISCGLGITLFPETSSSALPCDPHRQFFGCLLSSRPLGARHSGFIFCNQQEKTLSAYRDHLIKSCLPRMISILSYTIT